MSEYLSSLKTSSVRSSQSQSQSDPFFDLILNDVKSEKIGENPSRKSPLQDSKISSSEAMLSLNAANNSQINKIKQEDIKTPVEASSDTSNLLGKC